MPLYEIQTTVNDDRLCKTINTTRLFYCGVCFIGNSFCISLWILKTPVFVNLGNSSLPIFKFHTTEYVNRLTLPAVHAAPPREYTFSQNVTNSKLSDDYTGMKKSNTPKTCSWCVEKCTHRMDELFRNSNQIIWDCQIQSFCVTLFE